MRILTSLKDFYINIRQLELEVNYDEYKKNTIK